MSHVRERLPGAWIAGSVITAEELEALGREPIPRYSALRVGGRQLVTACSTLREPLIALLPDGSSLSLPAGTVLCESPRVVPAMPERTEDEERERRMILWAWRARSRDPWA